MNLAAQATLPPTPSPEAARLRADLLARGGRAVLLQADAKLLGEMLIVRPPPGRTLAEQERQAIRETLQQTSGRLAVAARRLGISRTTLWRRLRGVQPRMSSTRSVAPGTRSDTTVSPRRAVRTVA